MSTASSPLFAPSDPDALVRVSGVSKKFCLSLKKSLWYGLCDMGRELTGRRHGEAHVRGQGTGDRGQQVRGPRSEVRGPQDPQPSTFNLQPATDPPSTGNLQPATQTPSTFNLQPAPDSGLRPKEFWAVKDVGFELKPGESLGLIGHNGAGKTTLLKMLNGLIKPDAGRIEMRGRIGALIALGAGFNPILTGRENIYTNASVLGLSKKETDAKLDEIIDFAEIGEFIDTPVQNYSSGMAVRLGFAVAASLSPDILLLDEVLAVGDMAFQAKCYNILGEFRSRGVAFILVSHNMHIISRYCEKVLYMRHGSVVYHGDAAAGIAGFEEEMQAKVLHNRGQEKPPEAYGTGQVKIKSVAFCDGDGRKVDVLDATRPFCLTIEYECAETELSDVVMDVIVRGTNEVLFQGRSDSYGSIFRMASPVGRISVHFEALPVRTPFLFFSFCLMDRVLATIFDWKRDVKVAVRLDKRGGGLLAPQARWSFQQ